MMTLIELSTNTWFSIPIVYCIHVRDFFMIDDIKMPCEIALEADAELMKLFEEIDNERGQDSAFMDDMFGGWLTLTQAHTN